MPPRLLNVCPMFCGLAVVPKLLDQFSAVFADDPAIHTNAFGGWRQRRIEKLNRDVAKKHLTPALPQPRDCIARCWLHAPRVNQVQSRNPAESGYRTLWAIPNVPRKLTIAESGERHGAVAVVDSVDGRRLDSAFAFSLYQRKPPEELHLGERLRWVFAPYRPYPSRFWRLAPWRFFSLGCRGAK